jgi:hypothetical protein
VTGLHSLRARLSVLAARVPAPLSEWREVEFDLVESVADGRPVHTGTLILDKPTGCWREVAGGENTEQRKEMTP